MYTVFIQVKKVYMNTYEEMIAQLTEQQKYDLW